jgi:hypothetical protein
VRVRMSILVAAAIAVALIVVGCGGDDDSDTGSAKAETGEVAVTTSSLSKPAFIKEASAICAREGKGTIRQASVYLSKHGSDGLPEGVLFANMVKKVMLPSIQAQIDEISKLGAPAGDEEQVEALLTAQQQAVDEVEQLKSVKSIEAVEQYFKKASPKYYDYGFSACVYG